MKLEKQLSFDAQGLVPAIIQDQESNQVLMLGYINREALDLTLKTGKVHFWSRSRKKLWVKGETSGHIQEVKEIRFDCDGDTLLIKVHQKGGACHRGYRTCFYRKWDEKEKKVEVTEEKIFDPQSVYKR